MTLYGGGGYLDRDGIEWMASSAVAVAAEPCVGPTGEIAIFNIGSEVTITSDLTAMMPIAKSGAITIDSPSSADRHLVR